MQKMINNISVIIPVYNEEINIINLLQELKQCLKKKIKYEIIVVDDGSTDNTLGSIKNKIDKFENLKIIVHNKNYGQSISLRTGIKRASFDYIVTLDGDGQNDPADILDLVKNYKMHVPFYLVIGNRKKRNDKLLRRLASRSAFFIRNFILGDKTPDTGCALKVFKKSDFLEIPFFNHIHRFLPFMFTIMGGKIISINVNHRKRINGISKYSNFQRALVGIYDLFGIIWLRNRTQSSILVKQIYSSKKFN